MGKASALGLRHDLIGALRSQVGTHVAIGGLDIPPSELGFRDARDVVVSGIGRHDQMKDSKRLLNRQG